MSQQRKAAPSKGQGLATCHLERSSPRLASWACHSSRACVCANVHGCRLDAGTHGRAQPARSEGARGHSRHRLNAVDAPYVVDTADGSPSRLQVPLAGMPTSTRLCAWRAAIQPPSSLTPAGPTHWTCLRLWRDAAAAHPSAPCGQSGAKPMYKRCIWITHEGALHEAALIELASFEAACDVMPSLCVVQLINEPIDAVNRA